MLKEEILEILCAMAVTKKYLKTKLGNRLNTEPKQITDRLSNRKANLTVARLTVNVLSPILRPLREAQAMSVTAGS
jgi:hypothetical protein